MSILVAQGVELLVYGMGTVVVFLTVLVFATRAMSWFVLRFLPQAEPVAAPRRSPSPASATAGPTPAQLAAITAALHIHRQRS